MILRYHSSGCCGVKVLCGFPYAPDTILDEAEELSDDFDIDRNEYHFSGEAFQYAVLPRERAIERLTRLMKFLETERPGTLCEATLEKGSEWIDELTRRGFKIVNEFWNQCSGNRVVVLHWRIPVDEALLDDPCDCEDCVAAREEYQ